MTKTFVTRITFAAALVLLSFTATLSAQTQAPEAIVTALYQRAKAGADGPAFGIKPADRRMLSASLAALWAKADRAAKKRGDEVGAISYDIVTQSQGVDIASYKVKRESTDTKSAVIEASFVIGGNHVRAGEEVIVIYDFVRENGAWKIDDLRTASKTKPWSLRQNLTRSLQKG